MVWTLPCPARLILHKEPNATFIVYLVFVLCGGIKIKFSVILCSSLLCFLLGEPYQLLPPDQFEPDKGVCESSTEEKKIAEEKKM